MNFIGKIVENIRYISKLWKICFSILFVVLVSLLLVNFLEIIILILESKFPSLQIIRENLKNVSILVLIFCLVIFALLVWILFFVPKTVSPLLISSIQVVNDKNDNNRRSLQILLSNPSSKDIILHKFYVKWRYDHGMAAAIDQGKAIEPSVQYHFKLAIDTDNNTTQVQDIDMNPPISVPSDNGSGPGITMIEVEFSYYFDGRLDYHPCCDWNIIYDLEVIDINNVRTTIFTNRTWEPVDPWNN